MEGVRIEARDEKRSSALAYVAGDKAIDLIGCGTAGESPVRVGSGYRIVVFPGHVGRQWQV